MTFEAQGNGAKVSVQGTAADGSRIAYSYRTNYDGKDSPISGTGVTFAADTNATKSIDANTTESTRKKAGKVVATLQTVVSKDGKVLTVTVKGTDANGQPVNITCWSMRSSRFRDVRFFRNVGPVTQWSFLEKVRIPDV